MTGHTKEPWLLSGRTVYTLRHSKWAGQDTLENAWSATVHPDGQHKTPVAEIDANARRIVDCINALAGVENPAAFVQAARGMERLAELATQWHWFDTTEDGEFYDRDELFGALGSVISAFRAAGGEA